MNKIEELEAQLMAERIKVQIDLKEKYKWVIGKYVKHNDSFMIRIDDICHVHTSCMNGYADNLEPDDSIYINGTVAHCDVKNNYYSLSKDENIQVQAKDVIDIPDREFKNMVERLFNEAKELIMKIIKMNIKRYKEIIRKKDILTRSLSEARKLNKSIIWE